MKKIIFSTPEDRAAVRFLSNDSNYPFVLGDKKWPTVSHYVYAKKFEGTELEEMIRQAPTVFQAKQLASRYRWVYDADPLTGAEVRIKGYGRNHQFRHRADWQSSKEACYRAAIEAKFSARPSLKKKLLETKRASLIDSTNPLTGPILEALRRDLQISDPSDTEILGENKKILSSLMFLSKKISKMEGWDKIYKEMVEDAAALLAGEDAGKEIEKAHSEYSAKKENRLPNYKKLARSIQSHFGGSPFQPGCADFLASFFSWKEKLASSEEAARIVENAGASKTMKFSLRPGRRWYRDVIPPALRAPRRKRKEPPADLFMDEYYI